MPCVSKLFHHWDRGDEYKLTCASDLALMKCHRERRQAWVAWMKQSKALTRGGQASGVKQTSLKTRQRDEVHFIRPMMFLSRWTTTNVNLAILLTLETTRGVTANGIGIDRERERERERKREREGERRRETEREKEGEREREKERNKKVLAVNRTQRWGRSQLLDASKTDTTHISKAACQAPGSQANGFGTT